MKWECACTSSQQPSQKNLMGGGVLGNQEAPEGSEGDPQEGAYLVTLPDRILWT